MNVYHYVICRFCSESINLVFRSVWFPVAHSIDVIIHVYLSIHQIFCDRPPRMVFLLLRFSL